MNLNSTQIAQIGYVTFRGYHSYNNYKMLLKSYEVELPKEKTLKYDSMFTEGTIDYTSYFTSTPKCGNRKIKLAFKIVEVTDEEWINIYNNLVKNIHNKTFDDIYISCLESYYSGKVTIDSVRSNYLEKTISMIVDAQPYSLSCVAKETYNVTFTSASQAKSWSIPTAFLYKTSKGDIVHAVADNPLRLTLPSTWIDGISDEYIGRDKVNLGEIEKYSNSVSATLTSVGYTNCNITLIALRKVTA